MLRSSVKTATPSLWSCRRTSPTSFLQSHIPSRGSISPCESLTAAESTFGPPFGHVGQHHGYATYQPSFNFRVGASRKIGDTIPRFCDHRYCYGVRLNSTSQSSIDSDSNKPDEPSAKPQQPEPQYRKVEENITKRRDSYAVLEDFLADRIRHDQKRKDDLSSRNERQNMQRHPHQQGNQNTHRHGPNRFSNQPNQQQNMPGHPLQHGNQSPHRHVPNKVLNQPNQQKNMPGHPQQHGNQNTHRHVPSIISNQSNQQHPRQGQYRQHRDQQHPNKPNRSNKFGGENGSVRGKDNDDRGTSRPSTGSSNMTDLSDLMAELRKKMPASGVKNVQSKPRSFRQQPAHQQAWRQGPHQHRSHRESNDSLGPSSASSAPPMRDSHYHRQQNRRPHLDLRDNSRGRGGWQQQQSSENFLQGRVQQSKAEPTATPSSEVKDENRVVTLPNHPMTLIEASSLLRRKVDDIRRKLRDLGEDVPMHDDREDDFTIDVDVMELLVLEYGWRSVRSATSSISKLQDEQSILLQRRRALAVDEEEAGEEEPSEGNNQDDSVTSVPKIQQYTPRPPVVCIMGHVDHGKTTLMDALRRRSLNGKEKSGSSNKTSKKKKTKEKNAGKGSHHRDVAGTEAGGITQIVSAFQVSLPDFEKDEGGIVTFLDTPGHAAFRAMRQSGSHAADVIVLVIAAEDGVSEQTVEIINFYKSIVQGTSDGNASNDDGGGITMVVALNKIDKPGVILDEAMVRIEGQLLEHGIMTEGMMGTGGHGGSGADADGMFVGPPVQVIPTSGLTGQGLDELMEGLLLQSEVMDLRADYTAPAEGIIMDARVEKGMGVVTDCIIRWGTLQRGDVVVSGTSIGRVKVLRDVNDNVLKQGTPSQPVRIIGFKTLPKAGDPVICVDSEELAEQLVERRAVLGMSSSSSRPEASAANDIEVHVPGMRTRDSRWMQRLTNRVEDLGHSMDASAGSDSIRIPIIVKADADGSLAAVTEALIKLGQASSMDVTIDPISKGIGSVTTSDIQLAKESNATIFVFGSNTRTMIDPEISSIAETDKVHIHSNNIIYSLLDEAKEFLGSYLPQVAVEQIHGKATVQATFQIDGESGKECVAGLRVTEGTLYKAKGPSSDQKSKATHICYYRVFRNGEQVCPIPVDADRGVTVQASSLRHFKELVDSVRRGDECGLVLNGFHDFQDGDIIECFSIELKAATL